MKLTGLAKEAFFRYIETATKINTLYDFNNLPESCQNALIIEFFDSAGVWNKVFLECYDNGLGNCKEATISAIEKANVIYNESKL